MDDEFAVLVGVDWGHEQHHVCALTAAGTLVLERAIPNEPRALGEVLEAVQRAAGGDPGRVAVAIEIPHGPVVETVLERGMAVFALNPKQLDRFRDRFGPAGAKDDRRDARVLGDSLRTDRRAFTRVRVAPPARLALREESRIHEELTAQLVQLANRLEAQLQRFYPQVLAVGRPSEPWLWALLAVAPTPAAAARLRPSRVAPLLRRYRIRRHDAAQVVATLHAPGFAVAPGSAAAAARHVAVLLEQLRLLHRQLQHCDRRLAALLAPAVDASSGEGPRPEPSDAEILCSMPGVGIVVAACLLSEAGDALTDGNRAMLRALCGVAPVTKRSGKALTVVRRYACNARLRTACHYWGHGAAIFDPHSHRHYTRLRAAGHSHGRAVRGVTDRLLAVLIAMLASRTLYDPTRRAIPAAA